VGEEAQSDSNTSWLLLGSCPTVKVNESPLSSLLISKREEQFGHVSKFAMREKITVGYCMSLEFSLKNFCFFFPKG
jgi:hypothetical protein